MSEEAAWDKDWWRTPRELSLARKARKCNASALAKPGDAFLIVTEGTVTEPIYFDRLRRVLQLPVVQIKITPGVHSDPRHVIQTADDLRKVHARRTRKGLLAANEPAQFDHVWADVDTNVAASRQFWNEISNWPPRKK